MKVAWKVEWQEMARLAMRLEDELANTSFERVVESEEVLDELSKDKDLYDSFMANELVIHPVQNDLDSFKSYHVTCEYPEGASKLSTEDLYQQVVYVFYHTIINKLRLWKPKSYRFLDEYDVETPLMVHPVRFGGIYMLLYHEFIDGKKCISLMAQIDKT